MSINTPSARSLRDCLQDVKNAPHHRCYLLPVGNAGNVSLPTATTLRHGPWLSICWSVWIDWADLGRGV